MPMSLLSLDAGQSAPAPMKYPCGRAAETSVRRAQREDSAAERSSTDPPSVATSEMLTISNVLEIADSRLDDELETLLAESARRSEEHVQGCAVDERDAPQVEHEA